LALNAYLTQKVKGLLAVLFFEFSAVVANRCGDLREFGKGGAGLDVVTDRILPFFQPAVAQKLSASIAPVYEHDISPRFDSLN
jgi:hypothetical protein